VFENNPRAQSLYAHLGFAVEGRLRKATCVAGELCDVVVMGLLRDEWRAARDAGRRQA
jgi:RimJ/RimL family protein N-acetyltransferase